MSSGSTIPRPEYPRPQFVRDEWINLNGPWTFTFDFGKSGKDRGLHDSKGFDREITVPFCPESDLSGVGHKDFIEMMWYHRPLAIPVEWKGKRIVLHFGAVDWECDLHIDGQYVGAHYGGTVSFEFDITRFVVPGQTHDLVLYVRDELKKGGQPSGKQSAHFKSHGCVYTRTTGIWQTVWMEAVDPAALKSVHIVPDLDGGRFIVTPTFWAERRGLSLLAKLMDGDKVLYHSMVPAANGGSVELAVPDPQPWSPASPHLYDIALEVMENDGQVRDRVQCYAGLRKVHIEGNQVFLNNEPIYQRLVLDQGFYPDGIWTAPTDEALKRDIELSMAAGFNGARLHQKVFEERFHYWADRLGYLTWGESSSWGYEMNDVVGARNALAEWQEIVTRDRNHPSIIAWSPFNETGWRDHGAALKRLTSDAAAMCKKLDPTRPVNDSSGYLHVCTDLWTVHNYTQDPAKLAEELAPKDGEPVFRNMPDKEPPYEGQPYIVDEFGGIKWIPEEQQAFADNSWGYGDAPKTLDEFYARLEGQIDVLLSYKHITGYAYTQLTDVEQEQNGIYNYDRTAKFDMEKIRSYFSKEPKS